MEYPKNAETEDSSTKEKYTDADRARELAEALKEQQPDVRSWYYDNPPTRPEAFNDTYSSSQPVPLDPYHPDAIAAHGPIQANLEKLINAPHPADTPHIFTEVVRYNFVASQQINSLVNYEHYERWRRAGGESEIANDAYSQGVVKKAQLGQASREELIDLLQGSSLAATELYRLAVPYGHRLDQVAAERKKIRTMIEDYGGEVTGAEPYTHVHLQFVDGRQASRYRGKDANFEALLMGKREIAKSEVGGILVTYKRRIGVIGQGDDTITIKERQVVGIRVDERSDLPKNLRGLFAYPYDGANNQEINAYRELLLNNFIQTNMAAKFIVPLSVTAYAHKPSAERTVHQDELARSPIVASERSSADVDEL